MGEYLLCIGKPAKHTHTRHDLKEIYELISQYPGELCIIYEHTITGFLMYDAFPTGWHEKTYYQEKLEKCLA